MTGNMSDSAVCCWLWCTVSFHPGYEFDASAVFDTTTF